MPVCVCVDVDVEVDVEVDSARVRGGGGMTLRPSPRALAHEMRTRKRAISTTGAELRTLPRRASRLQALSRCLHSFLHLFARKYEYTVM